MNTFKVVRMAKRGEKSLPEFKQEWLELHRELKRTANKVVASMATGEVALGGTEVPFDGMATMYHTTVEKARAALADHPQRQEVLSEEFMVAEKMDAAKTIKATNQLKIVRTVIRRKDLTLAQFKDYWLKNHSTLEKQVIRESPVQHRRHLRPAARARRQRARLRRHGRALLREPRRHQDDVRRADPGDDAQGRGELRADGRAGAARYRRGVCSLRL